MCVFVCGLVGSLLNYSNILFLKNSRYCQSIQTISKNQCSELACVIKILSKYCFWHSQWIVLVWLFFKYFFSPNVKILSKYSNNIKISNTLLFRACLWHRQGFVCVCVSGLVGLRPGIDNYYANWHAI